MFHYEFRSSSIIDALLYSRTSKIQNHESTSSWLHDVCIGCMAFLELSDENLDYGLSSTYECFSCSVYLKIRGNFIVKALLFSEK